MSKLIQCKSCGKEIAKNAKSCPHCGAKNKKGCLTTGLGVILLFVGIVLIIAALGGGSDESTLAPNNNHSGETTNIASTRANTFSVGDRVEMDGIYVTLDAVTENAGTDLLVPSEDNTFVICEFTIENESSDDLAVSSAMSFTAYANDYSVQLSFSGLAVSDKQQLDGKIAAGKKMNGIVAYEVPANWSKFEIHFVKNIYSSKALIFVHSK